MPKLEEGKRYVTRDGRTTSHLTTIPDGLEDGALCYPFRGEVDGFWYSWTPTGEYFQGQGCYPAPQDLVAEYDESLSTHVGMARLIATYKTQMRAKMRRSTR